MHYTVRTPKVFLPSVWPLPRSLATTGGISVDFSSSPYLDVSVQAWLIAVSHVLHRLSVPRHSPCALCSLTIIFPTAFTIGSEILWFFVILKIGCFYNLFYPFRNCSIFTFVNIYHFNWGLSLTVDKQYFSLYLLSLFSFQGTFQKRTK